MDPIVYASRRSVVYSLKGVAASSQPMASAAAVKILDLGGNAADAAVGMAACMGVLEPMMTGIGGDIFALMYDAKDKTVSGINGCGKSPAALTVDVVRKSGVTGPRIPANSVHGITVPGAVAGWVDVIEKWGSGKVSLEQILAPAIELAEASVVHTISHDMWKGGVKKLKTSSPNGNELLVDGEAPAEGTVFHNKNMANVLRRIAKSGKDGYYKGETAEALIESMKGLGGVMTHTDLESHKSLFLDPVTMDFEDVTLHEMPPNNHGLVALIALGIIKQLDKRGTIDLKKMKHNSAEYIHLISEALKFGFKDAEEYISDPETTDVKATDLLTDEYLSRRADLFDPEKVNHDYDHGILDFSRSDTSYFTVADAEGNACSFIASIYQLFGSGIIPKDCGFALQNRGCNFNLTPGTRNCLEPSKRPYHTIIPAMLTRKDGSLYASYGVMGGFMQPQGHLQVLLNLELFGMNPQRALDAPRICINADEGVDSGRGADSPVSTNVTKLDIEEGIPEDVVAKLKQMGHRTAVLVGNDRHWFGRGQIIKRDAENKVYSAGSDLRGDGAAIPQI